MSNIIEDYAQLKALNKVTFNGKLYNIGKIDNCTTIILLSFMRVEPEYFIECHQHDEYIYLRDMTQNKKFDQFPAYEIKISNYFKTSQ